MSYNLGRAGAGGPGRGYSAASIRNPNYTTAQQSNYNSSQPVYSTQQPTTAAAQHPMPQQSHVKQLPPATPAIKQEPATPADTSRSKTTENADGAPPKPIWKKKKAFKVSKKVRKARQNARLRRMLTPRDAMNLLNELRPGFTFNVREDLGWGFMATINIDGKTYTGHGSSIPKAKIEAAEEAIKPLVVELLSNAAPPAAENKIARKADASTDEDDDTMYEDDKGEGVSNPHKHIEEDQVPWGSLAGYALKKMFTDWKKDGYLFDAPL